MFYTAKMAKLLLAVIFLLCMNFDRISEEESMIDRREGSEAVTSPMEISKGDRGAAEEKVAG
jgi:hypothetical protein